MSMDACALIRACVCMRAGGDVGGAIVVQYKGGQLGITYFNEDAGLDGSTVTIHGTKGIVTVLSLCDL